MRTISEKEAYYTKRFKLAMARHSFAGAPTVSNTPSQRPKRTTAKRLATV
jgi:hypothetical protein